MSRGTEVFIRANEDICKGLEMTKIFISNGINYDDIHS